MRRPNGHVVLDIAFAPTEAHCATGWVCVSLNRLFFFFLFSLLLFLWKGIQNVSFDLFFVWLCRPETAGRYELVLRFYCV